MTNTRPEQTGWFVDVEPGDVDGAAAAITDGDDEGVAISPTSRCP